MNRDIQITPQVSAAQPEFIRLPKSPDRCPFSGLTRAALNKLILSSSTNAFRPPVKSIVLKSSPRNSRGIRLIDYQSLKAYLHGQREQSSSSSEGAAA
jgi:hypothetical protein